MKNKLSNLVDKIEIKLYEVKTKRKHRKIYKNRLAIAHKHRRLQTQKFKRSLSIFTTIMAMSARTMPKQQHTVNFDTDLKTVGIDNRCSACISCDINDFIGPLTESNRTIKGFGGVKHSSNIMSGTIKWKWCDDQGKVHKHVIHNSYYVPKGKV